MTLLVIFVLAALAGLMMGKYPMQLGDVWHSLTTKGSAQSAIDLVIWNVRMPRLVAAVVVGSALAAAGSTYQAMFRNPLVSPDILGVSAGSGLGAVLAIYLSLPLVGVQLFAFIGGLAAVGLVYLIAQTSRRYDPVLVLVLAGVAIGTLFGSAISLIKIMADPYAQLPSITFWLLGGLSNVSKNELYWAAPLVVVALTPLFLLRWRINLLSLSDMEAQALGVNTVRLRLSLIVCATAMTAAVVSFAGIIGWVGLVIPHVARLIVGPEFARLLPFSIGVGATFLLLTDNLARNAPYMELPLGVITALVGAPFFVFLLLRGVGRRD